MSRTRFTMFDGLSVAVLFLCFAMSAEHAQALTNDEIFNYQGSDREKILEDGARKEGAVVLYSSMIVSQVQRRSPRLP